MEYHGSSRGSPERKLLEHLIAAFLGHRSGDPDTTVERVLAALGSFTGADRCYLFRYRNDLGVADNTHEWCAPGINPQKEVLQAVPTSLFPEWEAAHRSGVPFIVRRTAELPAGSVRHVLESQGIRSLVTVPVILQGQCLGFVGFDWVRRESECRREDVELLKMVAQLLVREHFMEPDAPPPQQSADQLEAARLLLREVHHRIKNNMNAVASLLSLQAAQHSGTDVEAIILEARSRLQSTQVLYEQLVTSEDFTTVSLKQYIPELAGQVISATPARFTVEPVFAVQDIRLESRQVAPLGIILNECIVNVIKHAYAGQPHGTILLGAALSGEMVEVSVEDHGTGLPPHGGPGGHNGFGMQLITGLAGQLGGTAEFQEPEGLSGVRVVVRIPLALRGSRNP